MANSTQRDHVGRDDTAVVVVAKKVTVQDGRVRRVAGKNLLERAFCCLFLAETEALTSRSTLKIAVDANIASGQPNMTPTSVTASCFPHPRRPRSPHRLHHRLVALPLLPRRVTKCLDRPRALGGYRLFRHLVFPGGEGRCAPEHGTRRGTTA